MLKRGTMNNILSTKNVYISRDIVMKNALIIYNSELGSCSYIGWLSIIIILLNMDPKQIDISAVLSLLL